VGIQEDAAISISPSTMGLGDDPGEPFQIEIHAIRKELEALGATFVMPNAKEV